MQSFFCFLHRIIQEFRVICECALGKVFLSFYLADPPAVDVIDDGLCDVYVFLIRFQVPLNY